MIKIFISGALTSDNSIGFLENVRLMLKTDGLLKQEGFNTYCPCNDIISTLVNGVPSHDDFLRYDLDWLEYCDGLLLVNNKKNKDSRGVAGEINKALMLGIPIFHNIGELLEYDKNGEW
jgi:hypothetical protein